MLSWLQDKKKVRIIALSIFIIALYYVIALYIIYKFGAKYTIVAWSFPIILILLFWCSNNCDSKNEALLFYFTLSVIVLAAVLIFALLIKKYTNDRFKIVSLSLVAWVILAVFFTLLV